jgi:hypothetical protein
MGHPGKIKSGMTHVTHHAIYISTVVASFICDLYGSLMSQVATVDRHVLR